jgi:HEAT repeat protein
MLPTAPDLIDSLTGALHNRWVPLRIAAVECLAALGGPRVPPQLARLLGDADDGVRAAALAAHVAGCAPDALDKGCQALRADRSRWVRETAAEVLAKRGDRRAAAALRAALGDPDQLVRSTAMEALFVLEGADATGDLRTAGATDPSVANRETADQLVRHLTG